MLKSDAAPDAWLRTAHFLLKSSAESRVCKFRHFPFSSKIISLHIRVTTDMSTIAESCSFFFSHCCLHDGKTPRKCFIFFTSVKN